MQAQDVFSGTVFGDDKSNPLPGANVCWLATNKGTVTDIDGKFSMQKLPSDSQLVISYVGFTSDTLSIQNSKTIIHILKRKDGANLDEVVVSERKKTSQLSFLSAQSVLNVSSDELL
ncbi:MAG: carboxypeptidase-like regulatory domain-containing protein, partial [Bacteroidota bacterium]|nr:carboxypeptidase-like regulatory domain-containing protein [Bacteroidota bacterium]